MINEFVQAWVKNNNELKEFFENNPQKEFNKYKKIVQKLFELVVNPYLNNNDYISYPLNERI